jgi:hypothetical protein
MSWSAASNRLIFRAGQNRITDVMPLRVTVRAWGVSTTVLTTGETLMLGRAPRAAADTGPGQPRWSTLALPHCASYVSRVVGELSVATESVRLHWRAGPAAQLASLLGAPGGARRVTLCTGMSATLDEGENHLTILRGRAVNRAYRDLRLVIDVTVPAQRSLCASRQVDDGDPLDADARRASPAPGLARGTREWFVALAIAEPWLSGSDDYPRPPSNREIYERVLAWHGSAWNLDRPQRVDDAIRLIAGIAFGQRDDPFATSEGRAQHIRYAVGRRTAEVGLVTARDLERVHRGALKKAGVAQLH